MAGKASNVFAHLKGDDSDRLQDYIMKRGFREHPILERCRLETEAMGGVSIMQVAPDQGAFLGFLARMIGARKILEVGVFTGYSSLAMALAIPEDGRITACDISEDYTAKARVYWDAAGVGEKVDLRLGAAAETLEALLSEGAEGSYDMAFLDADKTGYDIYYERALRLLRRGGLIAIDNVLWFGQVADESAEGEDTVALRRLNEKIHGDDRVDMLLLSIADGLTLCLKR